MEAARRNMAGEHIGPARDPTLAETLGELTRRLDEIHRELRKRNGNPPIPSWVKWLGGVVGPLIVAGIIGAHAMIWRLNDRLTALETGEFTSQEAAAMEARILSRIDGLPVYWETLQDHEARIRALERGGGES